MWTKKEVKSDVGIRSWQIVYLRGEPIATVHSEDAANKLVSFLNCRKEVAWFAELMEVRLSDIDHLGGWKESSTEFLLNKLGEGIEDLYEALHFLRPRPDPAVILACAEAATILLKIADSHIRKQNTENKL